MSTLDSDAAMRVAILDRDVRELRAEVRRLSKRIEGVSTEVREMATKDQIAAAVIQAAKQERTNLLGWPVKLLAVTSSLLGVVSISIQLAHL